jgi:hypothetical protein
MPHSTERWASRMGSSAAGAKEVLVKISGGGRDADGVQAHLEYIDRHGKLELETDYGETLQGKTAATALVNEWGLDYGHFPGGQHSRNAVGPDGQRRAPRQAFNIVLSMPAGTPPEKVLEAAKKFARGVRAPAPLRDGAACRAQGQPAGPSARAPGREGGA